MLNKEELCKQSKKYFYYLKNESKNVKYYPERKDWAYPSMEDIYTEDYEFYYFKILNEEGLKEIEQFINSHYLECSVTSYYDIKINDVICFMIPYDNLSPFYIRSIEKEYEKIKKFFAAFE